MVYISDQVNIPRVIRPRVLILSCVCEGNQLDSIVGKMVFIKELMMDLGCDFYMIAVRQFLFLFYPIQTGI